MHDYHFFTSKENISDSIATIQDNEFRHCCRVLRHKEGDKIEIFDGTGNLYHTEILKIGKNEASCKILNIDKAGVSKNLKIHLAVGLVKSKALDLIIDQACSLGMLAFYPVETEHSIKKSFNLERYEKKALESIKQSGNLFLPKIFDVMSFDDWLNQAKNISTKLICYQHSTFFLNKIDFSEANELAVFIGPEGGFSQEEIKIAESEGFQTVNLFDGRLRTELAVTTALAGIHTIQRR